MKGPGLNIVITDCHDGSISVLAAYQHDEQEDVFLFSTDQGDVLNGSASLYIVDSIAD